MRWFLLHVYENEGGVAAVVLQNLYQHQERTSQPFIVLNGGQAAKADEASSLTVENLARAVCILVCKASLHSH